MKKISIYAIFLLIFSFSVALFPKTTHADTGIENYSIGISCTVSGLSNENYSFSGNKFTSDYSFISADGYITFSAVLTPLLESPDNDEFTYEWIDSSRTVISNTKDLTLYKEMSQLAPDRPLIGVVNSQTDSFMYVLIVHNVTKGQKEEISIKVSITDQNAELGIQSVASNIPNIVRSSSDNISFTAILPTKTSHKINWYIKYPSSPAYELISTDKTYEFSPQNLVTAENGYGEYKVMSIAETKTKKYYSTVYSIYTEPMAFTYGGAGTIKIVSRKIENTKASIEGFEYSLDNTTNMDYSKICWFLNGHKISTGKTFVYEPITTDKYTVSVVYEDYPDTFLDIHDETPSPTNTHVFIIVIISSVAVLSAILAISIIVTNKKRDVVW